MALLSSQTWNPHLKSAVTPRDHIYFPIQPLPVKITSYDIEKEKCYLRNRSLENKIWISPGHNYSKAILTANGCRRRRYRKSSANKVGWCKSSENNTDSFLYLTKIQPQIRVTSQDLSDKIKSRVEELKLNNGLGYRSVSFEDSTIDRKESDVLISSPACKFTGISSYPRIPNQYSSHYKLHNSNPSHIKLKTKEKPYVKSRSRDYAFPGCSQLTMSSTGTSVTLTSQLLGRSGTRSQILEDEFEHPMRTLNAFPGVSFDSSASGSPRVQLNSNVEYIPHNIVRNYV